MRLHFQKPPFHATLIIFPKTLIIRRALPVRGEHPGAECDRILTCKLERGTGSPVSAANGTPFAMLAGLADRLPYPPTFSFFRYLYDTHTRFTLRDNRVQRERWGNYTIFLLRTANLGLSARVSFLINRTLLS